MQMHSHSSSVTQKLRKFAGPFKVLATTLALIASTLVLGVVPASASPALGGGTLGFNRWGDVLSFSTPAATNWSMGNSLVGVGAFSVGGETWNGVQSVECCGWGSSPSESYQHGGSGSVNFSIDGIDWATEKTFFGSFSGPYTWTGPTMVMSLSGTAQICTPEVGCVDGVIGLIYRATLLTYRALEADNCSNSSPCSFFGSLTQVDLGGGV